MAAHAGLRVAMVMGAGLLLAACGGVAPGPAVNNSLVPAGADSAQILRYGATADARLPHRLDASRMITDAVTVARLAAEVDALGTARAPCPATDPYEDVTFFAKGAAAVVRVGGCGAVSREGAATAYQESGALGEDLVDLLPGG